MAPPQPAPGGQIQGAPQPGALAPPGAMLAGQPAPGAGGVPPAPSPYTDLSAKMPHAYQLLDVAARQIKMAIETGGFYRQPVALAGVRKLESDLRKIIQNYAKSDENDEPRPSNAYDGAGFNADALGNEGEDDAPPEGE